MEINIYAESHGDLASVVRKHSDQATWIILTPHSE